MKLRLICHGMMLFWYKKPSTEGGDDDGYEVLIPQAHHSGHLMHELRFGAGAGVPNPHPWLVLSNTGPVQPKQFQLKFDIARRRHRADEVPPEDQNLSLYEKELHKAVRSAPGIAYTIHVPYPHDEQALRVATYDRNPYLPGNVVTHLAVAPRRIVGARILTFDFAGADDRVELVDLKDNKASDVTTAPAGPDRSLHLYSQPAHKPGPDEDHTAFLNGMLKLHHKGSNVAADFDLTLDKQRKATLDPEGHELPGGLNFRDLLHLWELKALDNPGQSSGGLGPRFVDPAECGQGGGC